MCYPRKIKSLLLLLLLLLLPHYPTDREFIQWIVLSVIQTTIAW